MARLLLVLLAPLLLWPAVVSAETPDEYRVALAEALRAAEAARSALPSNASLAEHPPLRLALSRLESIDRVKSAPGVEIEIDNHALVKHLQGSRDEGRKALESLRGLLAALDASAQKTGWNNGSDARAALDEVLARPEFHGGDVGNPVGRFLDELRSRLFRWLESLFPSLSLPQLPGVDLGKPFELVFWLIAGVLILFTLAFFAFTWRSARLNLARYAALQSRTVKQLDDAKTARLAAQQAADQGDYRLAVHYLYLWAILHLAERSRLRYDRSLTNREQIRALAEGGEIVDLLQLAVDTFDRIWYGHAPCAEAEYGQFRSTVERIVGVTT